MAGWLTWSVGWMGRPFYGASVHEMENRFRITFALEKANEITNGVLNNRIRLNGMAHNGNGFGNRKVRKSHRMRQCEIQSKTHTHLNIHNNETGIY